MRRAALLALPALASIALAACGGSPEVPALPAATSAVSASAPPDPRVVGDGGPAVATVVAASAPVPVESTSPASTEPPGGETRAGLNLHSLRAPDAPDEGLAKLGSGTPPAWPRGPSVDFGQPRLSAPVSNAERVVSAMRSGFKRCYARALNGDPNLSGAVSLEATLGARGEITGVKATGKDLPPDLLKCISSVVHAAQFAPPEGGSATLTLPITMTRQ
jgi:hypothetical protein